MIHTIIVEALLENISRYITLTAGETERFFSLVEEKKIRKKQLLLQDGDICKHSIFVKQGCLRGYTIDKQGTEHNITFAPAGWWIADLYSLFTGKPGQLFIETTSDSVIQLLSREKQEQLFQEIPAFERFFRILTENALVSNQQRVIDNLSLSAQERYMKFCERYPTLINELPQKHIASYIGVTPEFFSKMLSKS